MSITTGAATGGNGGDITLTVGDGNTGAGGAMTLTAGKTTAAADVGGAVTIKAGEATNGGTGGAMSLTAGKGAATGGAVTITTGEGTSASSGVMTLATQCRRNGDSAVSLKTGAGGTPWQQRCMQLATGDSATAGATGDVSITTGDATGGNGGDITLTVGDGNTGAGGAMTLTAGKTTAAADVGGAVTIKAGEADGQTVAPAVRWSWLQVRALHAGGAVSITTGVGTAASSGAMTLATQCRRTATVACELEDRCWRQHHWQQRCMQLATGDSATAGATGDVSITTGAATGGNGGDITLTGGRGQHRRRWRHDPDRRQDHCGR